MRFAGQGIESYLGTGPKMGDIAQQSALRDAKHNVAAIGYESQVGQAGVTQYGETPGHGALMDAKGAYYQAQQQASNMSQAGGLLGNAIGGLGGLFGRRSGGGGGDVGYNIGLGMF